MRGQVGDGEKETGHCLRGGEVTEEVEAYRVPSECSLPLDDQGTVDRGVETSRFVEGGRMFDEGPDTGEVNPLIVLVDALRGASREEGVGGVFSVTGCSS